MGSRMPAKISISEQMYRIAVHQSRTQCDAHTFRMIDDHIFQLITAYLKREVFHPLDHQLITMTEDRNTAVMGKPGHATIFISEVLSFEDEEHIEIQVSFDGIGGCYGIGFARPYFWQFASFVRNEGNNGSAVLWSDAGSWSSSGFKILKPNRLDIWAHDKARITCRVDMRTRTATVWNGKYEEIPPDEHAMVSLPEKVCIIASFSNFNRGDKQSVTVDGMYWINDKIE